MKRPLSVKIASDINFIIFLFLANILQPTNTIPDLLQPNSTGSNNDGKSQAQQHVGSTWAGSLNIDLDNLMDSKKKSGPAPSMNQLKTNSNNTSPIHQVKPVAASPMTPTAINFPNMPAFAVPGASSNIVSPTQPAMRGIGGAQGQQTTTSVFGGVPPPHSQQFNANFGQFGQTKPFNAFQ